MMPAAAAEPDRALRMNDAVKYTTPIFENFSAEIGYGFGETAGNSDANRVVTGSVGYDSKTLNVRLAHFNKNNATDTAVVRSTLLAANYDFEFVKIFGAYSDNNWAALGKSDNYLVGFTIPYGAHKFIASYIRAAGQGALAENDADQWGIGYTYALSKRTNMYAAYGSISNDGTARYTVGNNSEAGTGNKAINFGLRHVF
jgi:predicted porin